MKKYISLGMILLLCLGILTGCTKDYIVDQSTVFVTKKDKIVSTDVEEFDTDKYSEKEFKQYIKDAVSEYNDKNGKKSVVFKKLKVKDKKATLIMEYKTVEDYVKFNGYELFVGTVDEAQKKGYAFEGEFAVLNDGKAALCENTNFLKDKDNKVVIIKHGVNVKVSGDVLYVSVDGAKYVDEKTISVGVGNNIFNAFKEESTETNTESVTESVSETENIDDEDAWLEESTEEMQFDFEPDEFDAPESEKYVYIIYK